MFINILGFGVCEFWIEGRGWIWLRRIFVFEWCVFIRCWIIGVLFYDVFGIFCIVRNCGFGVLGFFGFSFFYLGVFLRCCLLKSFDCIVDCGVFIIEGFLVMRILVWMRKGKFIWLVEWSSLVWVCCSIMVMVLMF